MRDHIRREAAQFGHAAWWLVPIVFATAAVAAVVVSETETFEPGANTIALPSTRPEPAAMPAVAVMPASTNAQPQQPQPVYEVEHIQAF